MSLYVWMVRPGPQGPDADLPVFLEFLDEVGRNRVADRNDPQARWGTAAAHAACRTLLCQVVDPERQPARWVFTPGPDGKPYVLAPPTPVDISISHTKGLSACAAFMSGIVGVDVENLDRKVDSLALARRFLHPKEADRLAALPDDAQRSAFIRLWTQKEAVVKAMGTGIQEGLKSFLVEESPNGPVLAEAPETFGRKSDWHLTTRDLGDAHVLSLAVRGVGIRPSERSFVGAEALAGIYDNRGPKASCGIGRTTRLT